MKGFKNVNVYVEGKGIVKTSIGFDNGIITCLKKSNKIEVIDNLTDDMVVVPGFIDQHIHGAKGFDAMDGTIEALEYKDNIIGVQFHPEVDNKLDELFNFLTLSKVTFKSTNSLGNLL